MSLKMAWSMAAQGVSDELAELESCFLNGSGYGGYVDPGGSCCDVRQLEIPFAGELDCNFRRDCRRRAVFIASHRPRRRATECGFQTAPGVLPVGCNAEALERFRHQN